MPTSRGARPAARPAATFTWPVVVRQVRMDENCTILVTGATGNCGGACARFLLANSQPAHVQIRCMVRDVASVGALALQTLGAELVRGDFGDSASLAAACRGVSAAFLGCSNQREQVAFETAFITAAAESPTLRYLVKLSTCGNVISPESPVEYGRIHAATEAALEAAFEKRSWTILRPNYFYQNQHAELGARTKTSLSESLSVTLLLLTALGSCAVTVRATSSGPCLRSCSPTRAPRRSPNRASAARWTRGTWARWQPSCCS